MSTMNVSHPEMITKSATVLEALTPEKWDYLMSLLPTRETYAEFHARLASSYAASLNGDLDKAKECEADRKAMDREYAIVQGLIKVLSVRDAKLPETLGVAHLNTEKATYSLSAAALTTPKDFHVSYDREGRLIASGTKVDGAKGYQVAVCDGDPGVEANWRLAASSSSCRGIAVLGLNRSRTNYLRMRAIRGKSFGPWSNIVSLGPV